MKPGTPLPWRYAYGSVWTGKNVNPNSDAWVDPYDADETCIAFMDRSDRHTHGAERDQNAAYIAHACNLYPELVKELRDLVQAIYAEVPDTDDMEKTQPDLYIECGTAEQLLAKCEE